MLPTAHEPTDRCGLGYVHSYLVRLFPSRYAAAPGADNQGESRVLLVCFPLVATGMLTSYDASVLRPACRVCRRLNSKYEREAGSQAGSVSGEQRAASNEQ